MGLIPRYHLFSRRTLRLALYPDQHQGCAVTGLPVPVYFARNFPHISSVIEPGDFHWALAVGAFSLQLVCGPIFSVSRVTSYSSRR
jgi:hypothetical protein